MTQAPSLHAALGARLQRCLHSISASFSLMHQDLSPLNQLLKAHERAEAQREKQDAAQQEAGQGQQQGQGQGRQGAAGAQPKAGGAAPAPIPVRKPPSKEEVEALRRSDDIIMRVLSTYSHTMLLPSQQAGAPTASVVAPPSAATGAAPGGSQLPAASVGGGSEASEPAAKRARR